MYLVQPRLFASLLHPASVEINLVSIGTTPLQPNHCHHISSHTTPGKTSPEWPQSWTLHRSIGTEMKYCSISNEKSAVSYGQSGIQRDKAGNEPLITSTFPVILSLNSDQAVINIRGKRGTMQAKIADFIPSHWQHFILPSNHS